MRDALPLELSGQKAGESVVQSLYVRKPFTRDEQPPYERLNTDLFLGSSGSSDQDMLLVAIAQASGTGKTKVAFDAGMCAGRFPRRIVIALKITDGNAYAGDEGTAKEGTAKAALR